MNQEVQLRVDATYSRLVEDIESLVAHRRRLENSLRRVWPEEYGFDWSPYWEFGELKRTRDRGYNHICDEIEEAVSQRYAYEWAVKWLKENDPATELADAIVHKTNKAAAERNGHRCRTTIHHYQVEELWPFRTSFESLVRARYFGLVSSLDFYNQIRSRMEESVREQLSLDRFGVSLYGQGRRSTLEEIRVTIQHPIIEEVPA